MDNRFDVAIIGGGFAGVCAAITTARAGLRTILIEQNSFLGGTAVAGMHRYICGLYLNNPDNPFELLNTGLCEEVVSILSKLGYNKPTKLGKVEVLSIDYARINDLFSELTAREINLTVFLSTKFESAQLDGKRVSSLSIKHGDTVKKILVHHVIDASGVGSVIDACDAGYYLKSGAESQLSGYSFNVKGLINADKMLQVKVPYVICEAVKQGTLPEELRFSMLTLSEDFLSAVVKLSIDKTDARIAADQVFKILKKEVDEFSKAEISEYSPYILGRDASVRLKGKELLTDEDVTFVSKPKNGVVNAAWPLEFWSKSKGPQFQYLDQGEYYKIPEGCLKSAEISNLYAAGRCISITTKALASARVVGTCMALGEAAANIVIRESKNETTFS